MLAKWLKMGHGKGFRTFKEQKHTASICSDLLDMCPCCMEEMAACFVPCYHSVSVCVCVCLSCVELHSVSVCANALFTVIL